MSDIAVRVENLGKHYKIGKRQAGYRTLRESVMDILRSPLSMLNHVDEEEYIWAVKDVSFEVKQGDVVGIIGRNGAGKSTLLKMLSRITRPSTGEIRIEGRVGSLLEVGTGFHPELTGRENVFLNGAILGMKRKEIERKFDEIVSFAEVEKFVDTPVKHYSSGMYLRLAFAVAAHLEPEILVVDEVLAVGDAAFQKKCLGKMQSVSHEGRTVLFVSHNMAAVANLCQSGIVLERGQVRYLGTQDEAITEYLKSLTVNTSNLLERLDRSGSGEVRVIGIEFHDPLGNVLDTVASGQDVDICFHFESKDGYINSRVITGLILKTSLDTPIFLLHNRLTHDEFGLLPSQGTFICRIKRLPLPPSTYRLGYSVMADRAYLDSLDDAIDLTVVDGDFFGSGEVPPISHGVCLVDGKWRLEKFK